jgi:hypothetical protein
MRSSGSVHHSVSSYNYCYCDALRDAGGSSGSDNDHLRDVSIQTKSS